MTDISNNITSNLNYIDAETDNNHMPIYVSLPYIKSVTPKISAIFKNHNIKVGNKQHLTVRSIFSKIKDKTPTNKLANIVYEIPCDTCNKKYYGQSKRSLSNRITSHRQE